MSQPNHFRRPLAASSLRSPSHSPTRTSSSNPQANTIGTRPFSSSRTSSFSQSNPLRSRTHSSTQSQNDALQGRAPSATTQSSTAAVSSPTRTSSSPVQPIGRSATAADMRSLEERVLRLEESQSQSSSQTQPGSGVVVSQNALDRQRNAVARLGRNASGGPSAPPAPKRHIDPKIKRSFRRLVYLGYGGVKGGAEAVRLPYPGRGAWPKHPPPQAVEGSGTEHVLSAEEELTTGNQIRLHYGRRYTDAVNQNQLRKLFRYMLSHRTRCGVPADMTYEELVAQCASTFRGWVKEYTRSLSAAGRKKKQVALSRSRLASRCQRKAESRGTALRLRRYFFFSDGSKVIKSGGDDEAGRVRRGAVRADLVLVLHAT
ncbi:hypothetical protein A4X13_0g7854 [Tilletia indica]|uniref:Uncharacterized protein n=1 Tax=Tilletia indica TaxID=43049 RepID=A0A177T6J1_9BASI|nr:hypothetical protein A4X13_0g7854 [Tilletia indica]